MVKKKIPISSADKSPLELIKSLYGAKKMRFSENIYEGGVEFDIHVFRAYELYVIDGFLNISMEYYSIDISALEYSTLEKGKYFFKFFEKTVIVKAYSTQMPYTSE